MRKWLWELRLVLAIIGLGIALGTLGNASGNDAWLSLAVLCVSLAMLLGP